MLPRCFLLLADNPLTLAQLRAEIEDLGEETRCQTALTAEEALFRLSRSRWMRCCSSPARRRTA